MVYAEWNIINCIIYSRSSWRKTAMQDCHRPLLGCCCCPKKSRPRPPRRRPAWTNCRPAQGWWRSRTNSGADANWADGDSSPRPSDRRPLLCRHQPSWPTRPPRTPVVVAAAVGFGTRAGIPGTACCTAVRPCTATATACWTCPRPLWTTRWHRLRRNTRQWPTGRGSSQSPVSAARRIPVLGRPARVQTDEKKKKNGTF